jgi:hypothetical protein
MRVNGDGMADTQLDGRLLVDIAQKVASLEAKIEALGTDVSGMKEELAKVRDSTAGLQAMRKETRIMWTLIGLILGAGGSEAVQNLVALLGTVPSG